MQCGPCGRDAFNLGLGGGLPGLEAIRHRFLMTATQSSLIVNESGKLLQSILRGNRHRYFAFSQRG
jgi:hypothetical protein